MKKSLFFVSMFIFLVFASTACAPRDEIRENLAKLPVNSLKSSAIDFQQNGGVSIASIRYVGCSFGRGDKEAKKGSQLVFIRFFIKQELDSNGKVIDIFQEDEFKAYVLQNVFLLYTPKGAISDVMQVSDQANLLSYPAYVDIIRNPFMDDLIDVEVLFETPDDPKLFALNVTRSDTIDQSLIGCEK